ncbi:transcription factor MYB97-like [Hibiscus syriacus]|uniref:transcription factor MYB97-like n=1 Tax=Hibiscus syriacus TaxID=106335 RepID=UPI0019215220|nr:transcription factor MYB97-like [Hibiscus syriacus]
MSNNSDGVREDGMVLKKGPWTATEDALLAEYVKTNGEGNWNSIHKNTRLARCGKSCRLRWANHLRPNLKKVAFSPQEERMIIKLHAKMGNKWVKMATQLPGRTDNEIKNYWNTRVKRRQRQGLPLYPPDIHPTILSTPTTFTSITTCSRGCYSLLLFPAPPPPQPPVLLPNSHHVSLHLNDALITSPSSHPS